MKKSLVLILLNIYLSTQHVTAQRTLNASGVTINSPNGIVSLSIGEVFFENKASMFSQSEGIQNGIIINPIKNKSALKVAVYPNPTTDLLYFKIQDLYFNNLSYKIYNEAGIELLQGNITSSTSNVSLKQLPASIYLIKIYRNLGEIISYQVIKIN
jgi:hypothetical protein